MMEEKMKEPQLSLAKSASLYDVKTKKMDNSYDNIFNDPGSSSLNVSKHKGLLETRNDSESLNSFNY